MENDQQQQTFQQKTFIYNIYLISRTKEWMEKYNIDLASL